MSEIFANNNNNIETDSFFTAFTIKPETIDIPTEFNLLLNNEPHPLSLLAATQLQQYLKKQTDWEHNFGLNNDSKKNVFGKMFGVLVVQTTQHEIGYLAAFSGKLAGKNDHLKFVPPIYDSLTYDGFLNKGMEELSHLNQELKKLQAQKPAELETDIKKLKAIRKNHSKALQHELFEHYFFINKSGIYKSVFEIFADAGFKYPPSGAGECATPKLLQYAFRHEMKPIALAEFWWGLSPKSTFWKHEHFYPCCKEKCEPILAHMLG